MAKRTSRRDDHHRKVMAQIVITEKSIRRWSRREFRYQRARYGLSRTRT
jgi:hypothetical protein